MSRPTIKELLRQQEIDIRSLQEKTAKINDLEGQLRDRNERINELSKDLAERNIRVSSLELVEKELAKSKERINELRKALTYSADSHAGSRDRIEGLLSALMLMNSTTGEKHRQLIDERLEKMFGAGSAPTEEARIKNRDLKERWEERAAAKQKT